MSRRLKSGLGLAERESSLSDPFEADAASSSSMLATESPMASPGMPVTMSGAPLVGSRSEWLESWREMIDWRFEAISHASSVSTSSSRLANVRWSKCWS